MFCRNCGTEISDESKFCSKCGANQEIKVQEVRVQETKTVVSGKPIKGLISFYLQLFLSPIMLIIRMLTQDTIRLGIEDGLWRPAKYLIVPDNIKVVMYVLLVCAVIFSFSCSGKKEVENKNKILTAKILSVINVLVSIVIIQLKV